MPLNVSKNLEETLIRTFLAIPLDTSTLHTIDSIQHRLGSDLPNIRWVRSHNLHLTLRFFGNISEENLEKAAKIMVSVGSLFAPFSMTLKEIDTFPSTDRARVVWIGCKVANWWSYITLCKNSFMQPDSRLNTDRSDRILRSDAAVGRRDVFCHYRNIRLQTR